MSDLTKQGEYTGDADEPLEAPWFSPDDIVGTGGLSALAKLGVGKLGLLGALGMIRNTSSGKLIHPTEEGIANFWKRFEGTKVVDEEGRPIEVYHATHATEPDGGALQMLKVGRDGGSLGSGVYTTPQADFANSYAENIGGNVLPLFANIKNPLVLHSEGAADPMVDALVKLGVTKDKAERIVEKAYEDKGYITKEVSSRALKQGHDGIMQYRNGKLMEVVPFNGSQLKSSVGNSGEFRSWDTIHKRFGGLV